MDDPRDIAVADTPERSVLGPKKWTGMKDREGKSYSIISEMIATTKKQTRPRTKRCTRGNPGRSRANPRRSRSGIEINDEDSLGDVTSEIPRRFLPVALNQLLWNATRAVSFSH